MRLERRDDYSGSIDNIRTAVFYRFTFTSGSSFFPPIDVEDITEKLRLDVIPKGELFQYRSSVNSLDDKEFKLYEYSLFPPTGKYGDYNIMDLYSDSTRELIGNNPDDIEKLSLYAIPTIYSNTSLDVDTKGYFRAKTLTNGNTIYQFNAPEWCYKIELFDTEVTMESGTTRDRDTEKRLTTACEWTKFVDNLDTIHSPVVSIYFGPGPENGYNPVGFYFNSIKPEASTLEWGKVEDYRALLDELGSKKVVTLVSSANDVEGLLINTSNTSAYESKELFRNLNTIALRNDEWLGTKDSLSQVGEKNNSLYDLTSGTLLGNSKSPATPILNRKKSTINNNSTRVYSVNHTYSKNDIVRVSGDQYVSLVDNNKGNNPATSPEWVISTKFDDTFSEVVKIIVDPVEGGKCNVKYLTNSYTDRAFYFYPSLGYEFSEDLVNSNVCSLTYGGKQSINSEDLEFTTPEDKTYTKVGLRNDNVWKGLVSAGSLVIRPHSLARKVLFQFYNTFTETIFSVPDSGVVAIAGTTVDLRTSSKSSIVMYSGTVGNVSDILESMRTGLDWNKVWFDTSILESSLRLCITGIRADYRMSDKTTETAMLEKSEDGLYVDSVKSAEVIYTFIVGKREYNCKVFFDVAKFEVDNASLIGYYGESVSFQFYRISGSGTPIVTANVGSSKVVLDQTTGIYTATVSNITADSEIHLR